MASSRADGNGLALEWNVGSWKLKRELQLPEYPDVAELDAVLKTLESYPSLVLPGEIVALEEQLAEVAMGKAFLLQGGDCAESFKEFSEEKIHDTFTSLAQMSIALTFGGQMPVIKVGRMAGQFAKPRSTTHEEKDAVKLTVYKGDCINGYDFDKKSRTPDPQRLIRAYSQSAMTLNFLRALVNGGYAAPKKFTESNLKFLEHNAHKDRYQELARSIDKAMGAANGVLTVKSRMVAKTDEFWTSHECLLLPYEQIFTKKDATSGLFFNYSAHMLWIGERTRQLDGAHVEFLRGVANPIGIKVSDKMEGKELVDLIDILNPHNKPGRITVITRMGAQNLRAKLPHLIRAVAEAGQTVTWICDPVHGNAMKAPCGRRTRPFDAIVVCFKSTN